MTLLDPPAGLRAVFEDDHLVATVLADDLRAHRRIRNYRASDRRGLAIGDEQNTVEGDRVTRRGVEQLDLELGADLDSVLLAAALDDCVHGSSGRDRPTAAVRWT